MNNQEYVELVNKSEFPEDNIVPLDEPFIDDRGTIQNLWLGESKSVTLITSKKGSVRACHWHSGDFHGCYMISGECKYYERNIDGTGIKEPKTIKAGQMVFSKPNVVHKLEFLQDAVFITINGIIKNDQNYENSVHRVEF